MGTEGEARKTPLGFAYDVAVEAAGTLTAAGLLAVVAHLVGVIELTAVHKQAVAAVLVFVPALVLSTEVARAVRRRSSRGRLARLAVVGLATLGPLGVMALTVATVGLVVDVLE